MDLFDQNKVKTTILCNIISTVKNNSFIFYLIFLNVFLWGQSWFFYLTLNKMFLLSHDPSEIFLIRWFGAQKKIILFNIVVVLLNIFVDFYLNDSLMNRNLKIMFILVYFKYKSFVTLCMSLLSLFIHVICPCWIKVKMIYVFKGPQILVVCICIPINNC